MEGNNSYRVRTGVGSNSPDVLNVKLNQSFEFLNILSLKIGQKNLYKMPSAPYGVVVGRVLANQTFGIENAKVSIFIPKEDAVFDVKDDILYTYTSCDSVNYDGVRYNLLPSHIDEECHQDVGTMFEKEYVLDNDDIIRIFDKYYTYTTKTNGSGDYFIYGVPVGQHTLHVDVDLSDIGKLSVRPHDMVGHGYNIGMFESPNKFKSDKNLNILPQIKSQDKPIQVFPFWGDTSDDDTNAMITRADIEIDYKFEPTAVFMGSIITDKGSNSISHKCVPDVLTGKMSELSTGEGKIEMIRKTFDGKVEEFSVKGNRLIDGDGVWCYQVPMNLDYVGMDEFGNIVPTDDPNRGIPTRARVRFRISMDEDPMDDSARKRARFLVPNNPRLTDDYPNFKETLEADYTFGTFTKDESYRDLFWNNVYTVKSYIPRLQRRGTANTKKFTGIKMTNHPGDNNPMPYNNLSIKMNFLYMFLCSIINIFLRFVKVLNTVLAYVGIFLFKIGAGLAKFSASDPIEKCNNNTEGDGGDIDDESEDNGTGRPLLRAAVNSVLAGLSIVIRFRGDLCEDGDINDREKILGGKKAIEKWAETYIGFLDNWKQCNEYYTGPKEKCKGTCYNCKIKSGKKYLWRIWKSCTFFNGLDNERYGTNSPEIYIEGLKNDKVNNTLVDDVDDLMNCLQNMLAQENEVTSFNFHNDWINGVLYAPLWYRKIKPRRRVRNTNLSINKVDDWCSSDPSIGGKKPKKLKIAQTCSQQRRLIDNGKRIKPIEAIFRTNGKYLEGVGNTEKDCFGLKCHKKNVSLIKVDNGIIVRSETKYGEFVYYYKSVEYSDKSYLKNILAGNNSSYGDVKILFATDLVLLGNLNECNDGGIPQFFKHLNETTYQMPPDLVSVTYDINDNTQSTYDDNNEDDEDSPIPNSVQVEFTGADYGNVGFGQLGFNTNNGDGYTQTVNTKETPGYDNGGLFYNLTCLSSFVSPKGCVNLSRICELGVSLDQSIDLIKTNGQTQYIPPDGFVSYDELYNMDARSMFSTMNCNWLREKVEKRTGYKTYNFNYNYPENFDGTLKDLMKISSDPNLNITYGTNYRLEESSDAYLRFRYGFDSDSFKVGFYNTTDFVKRKPNDDKYTQTNERRFPRYENSFYFYFGLKSGSTAINKFMEQFYAECASNDESDSVISLDYKPNSWCRNREYDADGYISFNLSNIPLPCTISFDEVTEGDAYDVEYTGITSYKLYIGYDNARLNSQNYDRLYVDPENVQVNPAESDNYIEPFLYNGRYIVTITDADGNTYKETVSMVNPTLSFIATPFRFTMTNSELGQLFDNGGTPDYNAIASDTTISQTNSLLRSIGGYITVSSIMNVNTPLTDNFIIDIVSENTIEGYNGSTYTIYNGNVTKSGTNPINENNGEYSFGLPKANETYIVTVTELCSEYNYSGPSENKASYRIYVGEPASFKMYVNNIDTSLLSKFKTGYRVGNGGNVGVIDSPYNGYSDSCGIGYRELNDDCVGVSLIVGWDDIGDVGVYKQLSPPSGAMIPYSSISPTLSVLTKGQQVQPEIFDFSDEYYFDKSVIGLDESDSLEDYFNTDIESQTIVINAINEVIQRRLYLAESMYEAFCIFSEDEKGITIQAQTPEKPVKTLLYYNPDNSFLQVVGESNNTQHGTRYIIFDKNKEENELVNFGNPTITVKERVVECVGEENGPTIEYPEYYPVFGKTNLIENTYKLPPYCAVMNGINATVPSDTGQIPFGGNDIVSVMDTQVALGGDGMSDMFGFHIIDKRPFTRMNIWLPAKEYPFYWPDVDTSQEDPAYEPPEGAEKGGYFNMNGCASGYLYNCFSTSQTQVASFDSQYIGEGNRVEFYTLTTRGTSGIPNEYAVPTKRVMYSQPKDDDYVYTYNDFECKTEPDYLCFDCGSRPYDTAGINTEERYISFSPNASSFTITSKFSNFSEGLALSFGLQEDTIITEGGLVRPSFFDNDGNLLDCNFKILASQSKDIDTQNQEIIYKPNPLYQKVYSNSHFLIETDYDYNDSNFSMFFNDNRLTKAVIGGSGIFDNDGIIPQDSTSFFIVSCTTDGKYRAISKTYEVTCTYRSDSIDVQESYGLVSRFYIDILYEPESIINVDYYLRYYPFRIIVEYTVNNTQDTYVSDLLNANYDSITDIYNNRKYYRHVTNISPDHTNIDKVYIKDITGTIRKAEVYIQ